MSAQQLSAAELQRRIVERGDLSYEERAVLVQQFRAAVVAEAQAKGGAK